MFAVVWHIDHSSNTLIKDMLLLVGGVSLLIYY